MPLKPLTAALYLDNYGFEWTLRLGYLIHPRTRQFRKNGLTTRAEGGTHWTIDRFERAVTLHVRTVASRGRPHTLDFVEGLLRYMCRQWRLDHIEKTVTLHVRTVASRGHPHILDVIEGLSCYMCRQRRLDHIEKTVLLHVQTVEPRTHRGDRYATCANGSVSRPSTHSRLCRRTVALHVHTVAPRPHREDRYATCADGLGHFRYSQRCRATVSLHVQTAVPRPRHYATCAGWRYRVWLYRTRRRTPKILGVASQPCSTWSSQTVSRIMGLTVFEATKTKGSMSLSLSKDSCYLCG